jgi:hypothetical protein
MHTFFFARHEESLVLESLTHIHGHGHVHIPRHPALYNRQLLFNKYSKYVYTHYKACEGSSVGTR